MSQTRAPLFAGLAALLVVGLLVAWFLLQRPTNDPVANANSHTRVAQSNGPKAVPDGQPSSSNNSASGENKDAPAANKHGDTPDVMPPVNVRITGTTVDADGDSVSAIPVTLLPENLATTSGPTATSLEDGTFALEAMLEVGAQYFVACLAEGKALTATAPFTIAADTPIEGLLLTIFETARCFGVVLNGANNEPLEGVTIETSARADGKLQRLGAMLGRLKPCVSDTLGKYTLEGLTPGKHMISAAKKGWVASEINPLQRGRQECELAEYANFELLPFILVQAAIIEGRVLAKAGNKPIAGAMVDLGTPLGGSFATTTSDAEGNYRFDNAPPTMEGGPGGAISDLGGLAVRAMAPGFAMGQSRARARSGETRKVDIILDAGCIVRGTVSDEAAKPVAGANVYFNDTEFQGGGEMTAGIRLPPRAISTVTNENGEFELSSLAPGNVEIFASKPGYANGSATATTIPGTPATVGITIGPERAIFGRVSNDRGEAVAGVAVAAYMAESPQQLGFIMRSFFGETLPDRGENPMFPVAVQTAEDGTYRLGGLKETSYVLIANGAGFEKHVSKALDTRTAREIEYNITLPPGGIVYGRVYDGNGKPVPGVGVTGSRFMAEQSLTLKTVYTDRNGNYEMSGLATGTYKVMRTGTDMSRLFMPNPANEVAVKAGERVQFDLHDKKPGTARIYGRVTLDGKPYTESQLLLLGGGFAGFAANMTTTDDRGGYEFKNVPLGIYQIARSGQMGPSLIRIRVRADKPGDHEINVDFVSVSIAGRVELEGGGAVPNGVRVFASPVSPEGEDRGNADERVNDLEMLVVEEARTNEKGEFRIEGLSPGFYRLSARGDTGMVTRPYLNVRASVAGVVLQLPLKAATLRGTVKGLDQATPNTQMGLIAALSLEDDKGRPVSLGRFADVINLGQEKSFTVPGIAEGAYTVTLSLTGYTPVTHTGVRFTASETTALDFTFAASGSARFVISNADISISSAYELQFDIVNSRNEVFKKRFTFLDFFNQEAPAAEQNAFTMKDFPPETYQITMKLPGYKDVVRSFVIVAGQTTDVPVTFDKQ